MSDSILVDAFNRSFRESSGRQLDEIRNALTRFEDDANEEIDPEVAAALLAIHRHLEKVRGLNIEVEFSPFVQKVMDQLNLQAAAV
jgi:hypothetical protein